MRTASGFTVLAPQRPELPRGQRIADALVAADAAAQAAAAARPAGQPATGQDGTAQDPTAGSGATAGG